MLLAQFHHQVFKLIIFYFNFHNSLYLAAPQTVVVQTYDPNIPGQPQYLNEPLQYPPPQYPGQYPPTNAPHPYPYPTNQQVIYLLICSLLIHVTCSSFILINP